MPSGERAGRAPGHDGRPPEHPGPQRGGQRGEVIDAHRRARLRQPPGGLAGQLVQRIGVGPELAGGARQRLGDARPERGLQGRQGVLTHPCPRVAAVGVVRVFPDLEAERRARRPRPVPADGQERPAVPTGALGHAGQRAASRSPGQAEQHRLGLVVAGVPEQDGCRSGGHAHVVEGPVPGGPRGGLRAAGAAHGDRDDVRRREAQAGELRRHPGRLPRRPGLQLVIHGDAAGPQPLPRRDEGQRGGQGQRVGAAGARGEHEVSGPQVLQAAPNGCAQLGHGRVRAHPGQTWAVSSRLRPPRGRTARRARPNRRWPPGQARPADR